MKKIFIILALAISLSFGCATFVTASAELGAKDVVYGDNYIIPENDNPITNDKVEKNGEKEVKGDTGVALLAVAVVIAVLYGSSVVFRLVWRKKHEN